MANVAEFNEVFQRLKTVLKKYEPKLKVITDKADYYYLNTHFVDKKSKNEIMFAAVAIKKNYVSFHLFPIYVYPDLLNGLSADLKKHKQGKSCFNFKVVKEDLFKELAALTKQGFDKFKAEKFI